MREPERGPEAVALGDRERLAVLLQGAGLIAHLRRVDLRLARGWQGLRVSPGGLLQGIEVERGRDPRLPQERLLALLFALFEPAREEPAPARPLAGRGEGRRIARRLQQGWFQSLHPIAPDRLVGDILEQAPFLFSPRFAEARVALAGERLDESAGDGRPTLWVVGPVRFRRRVLERGGGWQELLRLLRGEELRELWYGIDGDSASELAARGAWREAVAAWEQRPPSTPTDRRARARALWQLGRFEEVLEALARLTTFEDRLARLRCRAALNQWRSALRELQALERGELDSGQLLALAPTAIRVLANLGQRTRLEQWRERSLAAAASCGASARGARIAAWASWDLGDHEAMQRLLEEAADSSGEPPVDAAAAADGLHARGMLECARGRPREAVRHLERALRLAASTGPPSFELGRLWNDLVVARVLAGDLAGAERAAGHAYRRLWRCDGPLPVVLALSNLAEIRIRRGRLSGVREILDRVQQENRSAGNVRARIQDLALEARLRMAGGRFEEALEVLERAAAELEREQSTWHRDEIQTLSARVSGWLGRPALAVEQLDRGGDVQHLEPEERPALFWHADLVERAREEAERLEGAALRQLWTTVLDGEPLGDELLSTVLDRLEPFRGARLLFDLLLGGVELPVRHRREASAQLLRLGAEAAATALDPGGEGLWRELQEWLESPRQEIERALSLLRAVAPGARLSRLRRAAAEGDDEEEVLLDGRGGEKVLRRGGGERSLELAVSRVEPRLRVVFALVSPALLEESATLPPRAHRAHRRGREARHGMIGESAAFATALERLQQFAGEELPLLLEGETGTGKELAARLAHDHGGRREGPFQSVNCAALPNENLLLSALFGHARGAFTGADRARTGAFEAAEGGTLFLDEIGDLPAAAQGTLLRALQEREVVRLGETRVRSVDVRVIAATHRDLRARVAEGTFRQDLFYRLCVLAVRLPPLREREGDVELLARHFAARQPGAPRISQPALRRLREHPWPGNVRELRSTIERAAVVARTEGRGGSAVEIAPRHLDLPGGPELRGEEGSYHDRVEAFRRRLLEEALERHGGSQAAAARSLGLSRQALSYLVRSLGIRRR